MIKSHDPNSPVSLKKTLKQSKLKHKRKNTLCSCVKTNILLSNISYSFVKDILEDLIIVILQQQQILSVYPEIQSGVYTQTGLMGQRRLYMGQSTKQVPQLAVYKHYMTTTCLALCVWLVTNRQSRCFQVKYDNLTMISISLFN